MWCVQQKQRKATEAETRVYHAFVETGPPVPNYHPEPRTIERWTKSFSNSDQDTEILLNTDNDTTQE